MRKYIYILIAMVAAAMLPACGGKAVKKVMVHDTSATFKTVYIWEPDGHTDFGLLTALKAGVTGRLHKAGYSVSTDPDATAAYFKVTLYDAKKVDGSDGYIRGRVFIIEAGERKVVYDVTAEARGGVEAGYPVDMFLDEAMGPLMGVPEGE